MKRSVTYPLLLIVMLFEIQATGTALAKDRISPDEVVAPAGCLSVPLYLQAIHSLNPGLPLLRATTDFHLSPASDTMDHELRRRFRTLSAYSAFQFQRSPIASFTELDGYTQTDCNALTYTGPDGSTENFAITESSPSSLKAAAESGKRLEFYWLSPQSLGVKLRYKVPDAPCTSDEAFAEATKVFDWSGANQKYIEVNLSNLTIDDAYLRTVADATGYDLNRLYHRLPASGPSNPSWRVLLVDNLIEMARTPVRQDFLGCGAD